MKLRYILIVCLFLLIKTSSAQTNVYHPFPDSNAWWGEMNWWFDGTCEGTDEHKSFMSGDTLIGAYHYQKLLQSGYQYSQNCGPMPIYYYNHYWGAIRQDTLQRKVFLNVGLDDTLLYDFNLSLGDTLPTTFNFGVDNYVSNVDSVLIGNNYRKKFWISHFGGHTNHTDSNYYALIEGIGGTQGLLNMYTVWFEGGSALRCFHEDNIAYIILDTIGFGNVTDSTYDCNLDVGIPIINQQSSIITIYPNPSSTTITISAKGINTY